MKKFIFLTLILATTYSDAWAVSANDLRLNQRDSMNIGNIARDMSFPSDGSSAMIVMDGPSVLPKVVGFSGGVQYDGTNLTLSNIPMSSVNGLTTALNGKFDTPAGTTSQYVRGDGSLATLPGSTTLSFNNSASRAFTTSTGAAGFQVSSSRNSIVNYNITIDTSVSLSGNSKGYVALEVAATNSSTPSDWVEIGRTPSGQSGTLVIGLVLNQTGGGQIGGVVPAGWYAKLRSVNNSGTPTYTYNSGQEVLI